MEYIFKSAVILELEFSETPQDTRKFSKGKAAFTNENCQDTKTGNTKALMKSSEKIQNFKGDIKNLVPLIQSIAEPQGLYVKKIPPVFGIMSDSATKPSAACVQQRGNESWKRLTFALVIPVQGNHPQTVSTELETARSNNAHIKMM